MLTQNQHFRRVLEGFLAEDIAEATTQISSGSCADYAEYKYRVGFLAGLRKVIDTLDEAETEVAKLFT